MANGILHTIKPRGGGDYTNLQTWESTEQRNLTAVNEIEVAEVHSGGNAGNNTTLTLLGWTTDKDRHIHIRASHLAEHRGTAIPINRKKAYLQTDHSANTTTMIISVPHVRLTGMQFIRDGGVTNLPVVELNGATAGNTMQIIANRCTIIQDGGNCGSNGALRSRGGGMATLNGFEQRHLFNNCLILSRHKNTSTGTVQMINVAVGNEGKLQLQHCTIIARNTNNALHTGGSAGPILTTRNCYLRSSTTVYAGTGTFRKGGADATNNGEAIHPPNQFVGFNTDNFTNVSSGTEDIHLVKSSSGVLIDAADNVVNRPFAIEVEERSVVQDWEQDFRTSGSGVLPFAGSGFFDIGADEIVTIVGPSVVGGYAKSDPGVTVSGVIGGFAQGRAHTGPTGIIGGFVFSRVVAGNELFNIVGGFVKSVSPGIAGPATIGGFANSLPLVNAGPSFIGGFSSGLFQNTGTIGGFTFGRPDYNEFAATRGRTLVAATSEIAIDQGLNVDAKVIFKQVFQNEFNAKLDNANTFQNNITAEVEVQKFKSPPQMFILSIDLVPGSGEALPSGQPVPNFDPNGTRQVCVTASGILGDGDEFVHAYIDFGDPFRAAGGFTINQSVSGFSSTPPPWTACHDYNISGLYVITVRGQDNQGMIGMNCSGLNLASGAIPGLHFPLISISGIPRIGFVPPSLQLSFTTVTSGILTPPFTGKQHIESDVKSPTDERILWSFGNRETSRRKNPITYYNSPGLYAPTLRYLYTNPSGANRILGPSGFFNNFPGFGVNGQFMVSDTLLVGFNR